MSPSHLEDWKRGNEEAATLALITIKGMPLDDGSPHNALIQKAYNLGRNAWERLRFRELRSEHEIKEASTRLDVFLKSEMQEGLEEGLPRNELNDYWQSNYIVTEWDWCADMYGVNNLDHYADFLKKIDLRGWERWEFMYLMALRIVDAAVRAVRNKRPELAGSLLYDGLFLMLSSDDIADGRHRNTEHDFVRSDRMYRDKLREFHIRDAKSDAAKDAALARHKNSKEMKIKLQQKWTQEKEAYDGNKSEFARHYSRLLKKEHGFEVEANTIATRWLKGL